VAFWGGSFRVSLALINSSFKTFLKFFSNSQGTFNLNIQVIMQALLPCCKSLWKERIHTSQWFHSQKRMKINEVEEIGPVLWIQCLHSIDLLITLPWKCYHVKTIFSVKYNWNYYLELPDWNGCKLFPLHTLLSFL
jgi:hypothetical protein